MGFVVIERFLESDFRSVPFSGDFRGVPASIDGDTDEFLCSGSGFIDARKVTDIPYVGLDEFSSDLPLDEIDLLRLSYTYSETDW